ncbi:MAG: hypothetical protein EBS41_05530 [Actinobacteria bacterium]|nr:hypothetical protein [Actinomycetota bacterium]
MELRTKIIGLVRASHFGPTLLVTTAAFTVACTQLSPADAAAIALAIFSGQLVVGWTNDVVDFERDRAAARTNKPLVSGAISRRALRAAIFAALGATIGLSIWSPLGLRGSALHLLCLLSATAYNLKLKATVLSVVPYALSFGLLPWAIYSAADKQPPTWVVCGFIFFTCAFHFLNVLKDLDWDERQQVLGLPQRLGRQASIAAAVILVSLGAVDIICGLVGG